MNISYIPARVGSKRLPNKNFKPFAFNQSITELALAFSSSLSFIDLTVLDTDSPHFIDHAEHKKLADHCIRRPKHLTGDFVSTADCLRNCVQVIESKYSSTVSTITVLQPTSPIRNQQSVHSMFNHFQKAELTLLTSVTELPIPLKDIYFLNHDNTLSNSYFIDEARSAYFLSGSIFIITKDRLLTRANPFMPDSLHETYLMSIEEFVDIDTNCHFALAQIIYNSICSGS